MPVVGVGLGVGVAAEVVTSVDHHHRAGLRGRPLGDGESEQSGADDQQVGGVQRAACRGRPGARWAGPPGRPGPADDVPSSVRTPSTAGPAPPPAAGSARCTRDSRCRRACPGGDAASPAPRPSGRPPARKNAPLLDETAPVQRPPRRVAGRVPSVAEADGVVQQQPATGGDQIQHQREVLDDVQAGAEPDPLVGSRRNASDGKYSQLPRSRLAASSGPASSIRAAGPLLRVRAAAAAASPVQQQPAPPRRARRSPRRPVGGSAPPGYAATRRGDDRDIVRQQLVVGAEQHQPRPGRPVPGSGGSCRWRRG